MNLATTDPTCGKADEAGAVLEPIASTSVVDEEAGSVRSRVVQHSRDPEISRSMPCYCLAHDPLQLSTRLTDVNILNTGTESRTIFRSRKGRNKSDLRKSSQVRKFYTEQNETIQHLLKPVDEHLRDARELQSQTQMRYRIAVVGSFVANIVLCGLQLYGAISSGSLSLFTTMADAVFDPMSNIVLMVTNRAITRVDARKFPAGNAKIETAGNIVFCFLMCSVSFILIVLSIRDLAVGKVGHTTNFNLPSVIAVGAAFVTKLCLFLYCWTIKHIYTQVQILWEDHRNDLFINGFGLLTSIGGSKLAWWIDPAGAIILSCLIVILWGKTAYSEFLLLIGVSADAQEQQAITYIAMTHSPLISQIDTVRAYHSGVRLVVEVDIVMDPKASLKTTHDVSDDLQTKLESLPNVERAYVHVDYETTHKPEHFLKKEL
ncbi:cation efflux family-domain-containing protein [Lipomyces kononenkoae]|uniref:Cation efflux family-domain-containing protein n=1 Tax=Lipomyces kononenkoae TaxID=34357 RepID=A0ACC3SZ36_LIPKO